MPGGKTSFSEKWLDFEDDNKVLIKTWCVKGRNDFEAYCILCKSYILVSNSGKLQLLQHARKKKHIDYSKSAKNSYTITSYANSATCTSFNFEQQVLRAEILWCLKVAEANFSFSASQNISDLFSQMFVDSEIAKKFQMGDRKLSYVISHGLGTYFEKQLIEDVKNSTKCPQNLYSLSYDETTTSQVRKQFDVYLRFWSTLLNRVESAYLGSEFLGHAQAEVLKTQIVKMINEKGLPLNKLLMISVDGPNVNKATLKLINEELLNEGISELVDIGTCPLHITHNAFAAGMSTLNFNVDEFACDIYGFFKSSAARKEDLQIIQNELELQNQNFLRHVSSRWLTLEPVVQRIIEQFSALKEYFLVELSKRGAKEVVNNARFIRIRNNLNDSCTLPYLHFILYLTPIFNEFLALFQTEAPVIHLLYPKMNELLGNILKKFVKKDSVNKSDKEFLNIDVEKTEIHLSIKHIDIGEAARSAISSITENDAKRFLFNLKNCYIKISQYLQKKLPLNNQVLKDVQFLNPLMKDISWIDNAIPRLCRKLKNLRLSNEEIDKILQEWKNYKLENFSDDMYIKKEDFRDSVRYVEYERNDIFWSKIFTLVDITGNAKYSNLAKLVKPCLTLMHGNADVERGFSKNKLILGTDRCSLGEKTIIGLRLIKDKLHRSDNDISKIIITPSMIKTVKEAHSSYYAELEKEKHAIEMIKKLKQEQEEEAAEEANSLKRKGIVESELKDLQKRESFLKKEIGPRTTTRNDSKYG